MNDNWRDRLPPDWYSELIIYDVGMNTGQDTEFYLKKGFKVIAIEANPVLCAEAQVKFLSYVNSGQLAILNVGVASKAGNMEFYVNEAKLEWSSFHSNIAGRDGSKLSAINVKVDTMHALILKYGVPYYLKIDIEGSDGDALWSALQGDYCIPYISVENGGPLLTLLNDSGYDSFKYVQQNNVDQQIQVVPTREGAGISHDFEFGASGKFGEDTDGKWLPYDKIYKDVNDVWNVETGEKNKDWDDCVGGWFDLHARHKDVKEVVEDMI